jgi:hypothetical protein
VAYDVRLFCRRAVAACCHSGETRKRRGRNPFSRSSLWIPGPRPTARPGMTEQDTISRSRGAFASELCISGSPLSTEGAGNAGCALHPRSRVQNAQRERTRAYRFSGGNPASPAQWLDGLYRALPGDEFFVVTVISEFAAQHVRLELLCLRGLNTSNGCQDHTALPYASCVARLARCVSLTRFSSPCDHLHARDAKASTASRAQRP